MTKQAVNNKRIAKNTLLLYIRTFFVMAISLYTSRVILKVLGVEDYGTYQVVGGLVAMFSVISSSLSTAISRFITFENDFVDHNLNNLSWWYRTLVVTKDIEPYSIYGGVPAKKIKARFNNKEDIDKHKEMLNREKDNAFNDNLLCT